MDVSGTPSADDNSGAPAVIRTTARQLLVKLGAGGLSPAAVARAGGLSVSEVEAVFPHRDDLLTALLIDAYNDSGAAMVEADRTPAVLAGIVRSALEAGELTAPRRQVPGPPLLLPEAVHLFGGTPEAPFSDIIERGIVLWSSLIGLLVFQVFSRTHDSVRDEAGFFDYAVAVAAEGIGLVVPLGENTD
ncbi:TetR/AcrR family transcriptional regulator [Streptomyces rubiginosohelvolus]